MNYGCSRARAHDTGSASEIPVDSTAWKGEVMESVYQALLGRRDEIAGAMASGQEVDSLSQRLKGPDYLPLLEIYRRLPVCGMTVIFHVNPGGTVRASTWDEPSDNDGDWFAFDWLTPTQLQEEIELTPIGALAVQLGFVAIGADATGGDGFYARLISPKKGPIALYRVYYDWYDPSRDIFVIPDAFGLVHPSLPEVLRAASFE